MMLYFLKLYNWLIVILICIILLIQFFQIFYYMAVCEFPEIKLDYMYMVYIPLIVTSMIGTVVTFLQYTQYAANFFTVHIRKF